MGGWGGSLQECSLTSNSIELRCGMSLGFDKKKGIEYPCDKCDLINVTFVDNLLQINFTLEDVFLFLS